jgi:hypothetical protein
VLELGAKKQRPALKKQWPMAGPLDTKFESIDACNSCHSVSNYYSFDRSTSGISCHGFDPLQHANLYERHQ